MATTKTQLMGLSLSSPVIVGSSGMTGSATAIGKLADAGAGAVVLKSLFEEQIRMNIAREAGKGGVVYGQDDIDGFISYYERKHSIDGYHTMIRDTKKAVDIPVIASINASTDKDWQRITGEIADAGADAIQLNLFVPSFGDPGTSPIIEEIYCNALRRVKEVVNLPVAVKIGTSFTNMTRITTMLADAGADAVVMFNRYYQPDISIDDFSVGNASVYSSPTEYVNALRWIALLSSDVKVPLVGATGIHDGPTLVKMLAVGAPAVEVVSTLYNNGMDQIGRMNAFLTSWMDDHGYASIEDFRGRASAIDRNRSDAFERVQYMKYYGDLKSS
ncbi:MAG: dihydroorotate dehydrogenase-like protein [Alkalispirochaeta sp.]